MTIASITTSETRQGNASLMPPRAALHERSCSHERKPMTVKEKTEDKLASARTQGQAQYESIKEMVSALKEASDTDADLDTNRREDAERTIHEDALSVE